MTAEARKEKKKSLKHIPPVARTEHLKVASIEQHPSLQTRVEVPAHVIEEYAQQLADDPDTDLPAIDVYCIKNDPDKSLNQRFLVVDGHLRLAGYQRAELETIPCNIRFGTLRDAILFAVGANHRHGMRRTNADKEKAVRLLLTDPGWGLETNRWIARECRVSDTFVANIKKAIEQEQMKTCSPPSANVCNLSENGQTHQNQQSGSASAPSEVPSEQNTTENTSVSDAPGSAGNGETPPTSASGENSTGDVTISDSPAVENENAPAPVLKDAIGFEVPEALRPVFLDRERFEAARKLFRQLKGLIGDLAEAPGGLDYRRLLKCTNRGKDSRDKFHCAHLANSLKTLNFAEPYCCFCPECEYQHPGKVKASCACCRGLGWTTEDGFKGASKDRQEMLKARLQSEKEAG